MTDTLDTKVKLDTKDAQKDAKAYREELKQLGKAEEFVAKAQEEMSKTAQKARDQLLSVRRQQVEGTGDAIKLGQKTKELNIRLAEIRETSRAVTTEQRKLREEQKRVRTEMTESAREARELARAQAEVAKQARAAGQATEQTARSRAKAEAESVRTRAATERATGRTERATIKGRSLHAEDIASARRINELEASLANLDKKLAGVGGPSMQQRAGNMYAGRGSPYRRSAGGSWKDEAGHHVDSNTVMNEATDRHARRAAGAVPGLGRMALGAGAAALGTGATAVGGIAAVGGEFERLRTSLETIEGSKSKAKESFDLIKQFAKETPYELTEVTDAFIQLKTRGLDSTERSLKAYGDTASAMGFKLEDMVQAVASAAFGEFEPLKKFGVSAKVDGDKVIATFDGVTTTIGRDTKSIERYIRVIGEAKFSGGMEKQSKTMGGQLSNLKDTVAQLADEAFTHGLGDALKDVVADMTATMGSGDELAKTIGETLGEAVRDTYVWVKEFIGPIDELPGKFRAGFDSVKDFVSVLGSVINAGKSIVETIGPANSMILAFGLAMTASLGPLGAVATAGFLAGRAISAYAYEVTHAEERTLKLGTAIQEFKDRVALEGTKKELEDLERTIGEDNAVRKRVGGAQDKVTQETLRRYGVADELQLPKEARQKLNAYKSKIGKESIESVEQNLGAFTTAADTAEFNRLKDKRKRGDKLHPSEKKRLNALSAALDIELPPAGKQGKTHLTEFETERKAEIDKRVKAAEVEAADAAILKGQGGEAAVVAARTAGKATRKNLEDMARKGVLPGDVERAALRAAGYDDVSNAPPPPIIVYDQKFYNSFTMPTEIKAVLTGDPATAAGEFAKQVVFVFETIIIPAAARGYATSIKR